MTTRMLLAKAHYPVSTLGPGRRAGIWMQGCTIGCPQCVSKDTWDADPATEIPVETVLTWLMSLDEPVDGVTVSGGEPLQQPDALLALLRGIHAWRNQGVDILVYTGYSYSRACRTAPEVVALCDALICGPYIDRLNTGLRWRGSSNQRIATVSALGKERYRDAECGESMPHMQVSVDSGRIYYIGIPRRGDMERLTERLALSGVHAGEVSWRP